MKFSFISVIFATLVVFSCSATQISEKKKEIKKLYKAKKSAAINKIKEAKSKIKNKLGLGALEEADKEEIFVYLVDLLDRVQKGSIEAVNQACYIFDINNTFFLEDALVLAICDLQMYNLSPVIKIEQCRIVIGDDGMEYDDGMEEEEPKIYGSFYCIPIHQWEKKVIEKIISSMAEKSLAQLLLDKKEMEKRGGQVHHVHPLRFIAHVMTDPYLKACISQFKSNYFKWSNFIEGYALRMREEAACDNLIKHIDGFCDFLKVDEQQIYDLINNGNYEGLIILLLQL